jgi:putative acetyltransferase
MITLTRTTSENPDFQELVTALDIVLEKINGNQHSFFSQFNTIDAIQHVVIAYEEKQAVGCGAIKKYDEGTVEVKRMYVRPEKRGKGIASLIVQELEQWGREMHFQKAILETGKKLPEAVSLYKKNEYKIIENYGQYKNIESSICFGKDL